MPLSTETTTFTRDVMGRYTANTWQEAMDSADTSKRPDARPFDVIVIGGGSFGSAVAQHLFYADKSRNHRILVLEAGPLVLPEHVQNLPMMGLNVPGATSIANLRAAGQDGKPRNEVWGLAWHSPTPFVGLAYCIGGRSVFYGGWSPRLLDSEMLPGIWPDSTVSDLKAKYFDQSAKQIGTSETNDFIFGDLHTALRQQVFAGIKANAVKEAIPLNQLPLTLENVELTNQDLFKLEAPLAVQTRTRAGFFPINKYSAVPLLMKAARAAFNESGGDDVKKRLMVVPDCHIKRLITNAGRVTGVETSNGVVSVPGNGVVIIATATVESARLALLSLGGIPNYDVLGNNLLAHLRSNLTIRIPRESLSTLSPAVKELQASALFVKGRHSSAKGQSHFHVQITAAGLDAPGTDSEAELFKKVPDVDGFDAFTAANDKTVVITLRGIGEMEPNNPNSFVRLDSETDEYGANRAFVQITPTARDNELWDAMDQAADELATVIAGGKAFEVLTSSGFKPVNAGQAAKAVLPFNSRRDGLGTTHHEAGTLRMGDDPTKSVTNANGHIHHVANAYVLGPALFPTIGSPNPMLTGVALSRRLADRLATKPVPIVTPAGVTALFDGVSTLNWQMAGRGNFIQVDDVLEAVPGDGLGLYWCTTPLPPDFTLMLEWMRTRDDDNSGVFIRFPDPNSKGYDNTAWVGVNFGFEVQIDEAGQPDGAPEHKTGAIYAQKGQTLTQAKALPIGQWNKFVISAQGQTYTVYLNGKQVTEFKNTDTSRGIATSPSTPSFMGMQSHTGRVLYRNIRVHAGAPVLPSDLAVVSTSAVATSDSAQKTKVGV